MQAVRKAILAGGLIGGAGDISYALIFYGLRGIPPLRVLQSVASGLLGSAAFDGGVATAALGLLLHFLIALGAAATFYLLGRGFAWLIRHAVFSGIVFGLCVYAVMNLIVLPLSALPRTPTYPPVVLITGLLSHMFLFGLPIALCIRRFAPAPTPDR